MSIFFTADTHFGHQNILKYYPRRVDKFGGSGNIYSVDQKIIEEWNSHVSKNDDVYHLGDFSMCKSTSYTGRVIEQLNGKVHLIRGNHDNRTIKKFKELFYSVSEYEEICINKQLIVLFHYPLARWHHMGRGSWHLHGHCHGNYASQGLSLDVGLDGPIGIVPIPLDSIEKHFLKIKANN